MATPFVRRRFRFGLKALFLGVTVLCLAMAWVAMQLKWKRDRIEARKWIDDSPAFCIGNTCRVTMAPITLQLFGERPMELIWTIDENWQPSDDVRLEELKRLFPEAEISPYPARLRRRADALKQIQASTWGVWIGDQLRRGNPRTIWYSWAEQPIRAVLVCNWRPEGVERIDELKRMFPEAKVEAVSNERWRNCLTTLWD